MRKKSVIILVLILLLIVVSCQKEKIYKDEFYEFGNLGAGICASMNLRKEYEKTNLIIVNSNMDYRNFQVSLAAVGITDWPALDFYQETLIAVEFTTPVACSRTIARDLLWDKTTKSYIYNLDMNPYGYTSLGRYISWFVVKEYLPNDIEFTINIEYPR